MPNWILDEEEYDDSGPYGPGPLIIPKPAPTKPVTTQAPKSTTKAPLTAPTPSPSPTLCKHIWRACSGKFGAYWWCPECKKTKGIYVYNKQGITIEDTALQWLRERNADSTERHHQLKLAKEQQQKRQNNANPL
jgi:hypothetical protein